MLKRSIVMLALMFFAAAGCAPSTTATTDVTRELEAEINAHDADVEAAEKAQK